MAESKFEIHVEGAQQTIPPRRKECAWGNVNNIPCFCDVEAIGGKIIYHSVLDVMVKQSVLREG
jgi:hypothetical protein